MVHTIHIGMLFYYLLACYIGMSWLQLAHICGCKVSIVYVCMAMIVANSYIAPAALSCTQAYACAEYCA